MIYFLITISVFFIIIFLVISMENDDIMLMEEYVDRVKYSVDGVRMIYGKDVMKYELLHNQELEKKWQRFVKLNEIVKSYHDASKTYFMNEYSFHGITMPLGKEQTGWHWCIFPPTTHPLMGIHPLRGTKMNRGAKEIPYPTDDVSVEDFEALLCMDNL